MYVTTYSRTLKRRRGPLKGKFERIACYYETRSLTPMHESLRSRYPGSKTYADHKEVITNFCLGLPLDFPMVCGGKMIAQS